jgi:hypothetical protein
VVNPERTDNPQVICVDQDDVDLLSIDAANAFANPSVNMQRHNCKVPKLSPVELSVD